MREMSMTCGGWTPFTTDLVEIKEIFEQATDGLSGVYYKPVAVASRVQDGTYFSFFCNARTLVPNAPNRAVLVKIYQPVGNEEAPIIESIEEIR